MSGKPRGSGRRPESGDLRVRRTRKLLREALVALVEESGYEPVTVRDIAERAMVNRATFYAHYDGKYDLLLDVIGRTFEPVRVGPLLAREPGEPVRVPEWLVGFLEAIAAQPRFYRGILGDGGSARVRADLRTYFEGLLLARIRAAGVTPESARMPPEVVAGFAASAALGSLAWWLERDAPYPAGQAADWYLELISSGVFHPLGLAPPRSGATTPGGAAGPVSG
ncbi:TetR/AcrR family transcriptional regulator [Nocardiopsis mangrovi]|uniref:TetR/AcrR family transcriptional regulator n=1 Tax=Nocardiopsis mangrovi TaxID=1179818 RepID=A0ABV9E3P3_9ACTN